MRDIQMLTDDMNAIQQRYHQCNDRFTIAKSLNNVILWTSNAQLKVLGAPLGGRPQDLSFK